MIPALEDELEKMLQEEEQQHQQEQRGATGRAADILRISKLRIYFHTYAGDVKAIDSLDLSMKKGELLGLVGESGCGKSVTALAIVGLLPPNSEVIEGKILLDQKDVLTMKKAETQTMRLTDVAIVFQDPMTFLNPVLNVGSQILEIITAKSELFTELLVRTRLKETEVSREERELLQDSLARGKLSKREYKRLARIYAISLLDSVRLPEPEKLFRMFPFELSGGMRQRVMIAMALARRPKLFLADEITTALDVTVQAQVLQLLKDLKREIDTSVLLITHDLGVVAEVCDRVAVMYAGTVVEVAEVNELFKNPLHPYTAGLLSSVPRVDMKTDNDKVAIKGSVPDLIHPPSGCRFHPRCPMVFEKCSKSRPELIEVSPGHLVSCFLFDKK